MPQLIPSAQRVLQVFELFAQERKPLSNAEIAKMLNLAESSCSDLLYTLRHCGYVLRMPGGRKFQPTPRLSTVAGKCVFADGLSEFVDQVLQLLTKATGETSMCGCLENGQVKVMACQESPRALRYVLNPGTLLDLHATALGKALLSVQSQESLSRILDAAEFKKIASETITEKQELGLQIQQGKEQGLFVARNEGSEGVFAISFACRIADAELAFSLVGPVHRFDENLKEYSRSMLKIKDELFS